MFAQGREVSRRESDQSKSLQEWGFKELEPLMIQVQERVKDETVSKRISLPETWLSARFNDLHMLLSGEPRLAYLTSHYLISRPPEPKFIARLKNPNASWKELFSRDFPWDLAYSLYSLNFCLGSYKKEDPDSEWLVAFGDKHHSRFVDMVEWLSRPEVGASEWGFSTSYGVAILNSYLLNGSLGNMLN